MALDFDITQTIAYKYSSHPSWNTDGGFIVLNNVITFWPAALGPQPTEEQLIGWNDEFNALPEDDVRVNKQKNMITLINNSTTVEDLKSLLLVLVKNGDVVHN